MGLAGLDSGHPQEESALMTMLGYETVATGVSQMGVA